MRTSVVLVMLSLLAAACSPRAASSPTATASAAPVATPTSPQAAQKGATAVAKTGQIEKDVPYCSPDGEAQKMDIYYPMQMGGKPAPAILYAHGGSWTSGDKASGEVAPIASILRANGYLLASINYRLGPRYPFPAQIEDVKCAVRFLRAHASEYFIDPERIAAGGASAGGHLVSLLGLTDPSAGFDVGEYAEQSSSVRAVVDMFGPADLTEKHYSQAGVLRQIFGSDEGLQKASPVTYITPGKKTPPFMIIQGTKDTLVPPAQSQELYDDLKSAGADATLVMVENAGHGFAQVGGALSPSLPEIMQKIVEFLNRTVKG